MPKTLLLARHAKSSWDYAGLRDHERPLLQTGVERTKLVAEFLSKNTVKPDLIISSHAVRAFETALLLADGFHYPQHKIMIESNIYYQDADELYDLAMALPDDKYVVMLVGHNPSMTQFVNMFLSIKIDYLPTTGVVGIDFDTDHWSQIPMASKKLQFCVFPKMLKK
jgi:phosphohistidine phosphatase